MKGFWPEGGASRIGSCKPKALRNGLIETSDKSAKAKQCKRPQPNCQRRQKSNRYPRQSTEEESTIAAIATGNRTRGQR